MESKGKGKREREVAEKNDQLKEIQMLEGHTGKVWSVAWNPVSGTDGKPVILASCGADKTVRIWKQNPDTSSFVCVTTIEGGGTGTGRSCSWSPDGDMLAITSYDGSFSIWKMIEDDFEQSYILQEKDDEEVVSVSWNPHWDLATCSGNCVRIWLPSSESEGYESLPALEEHTEDVEMVQWHPNQNNLFSCGCDSTIKVWQGSLEDDQFKFKCAQTLGGHLSKVCSISFNATGDKMVTSSADLTIKVWGRLWPDDDYVTWKNIHSLRGYHEFPIYSVHWSSEGIIASGAADGAICLFVENQEGSQERGGAMKLLLRKEKAHEADVNSGQWDPKSQDKSEPMLEMPLAKKRMDVMNLRERQDEMMQYLFPKKEARKVEVTAVQWSPKGSRLLASSSDNGTIKIWEFTPRQ
ncbi:hypothetical protein ACET3Z_023364 [Daucus carota]